MRARARWVEPRAPCADKENDATATDPPRPLDGAHRLRDAADRRRGGDRDLAGAAVGLPRPGPAGQAQGAAQAPRALRADARRGEGAARAARPAPAPRLPGAL